MRSITAFRKNTETMTCNHAVTYFSERFHAFSGITKDNRHGFGKPGIAQSMLHGDYEDDCMDDVAHYSQAKSKHKIIINRIL